MLQVKIRVELVSILGGADGHPAQSIVAPVVAGGVRRPARAGALGMRSEGQGEHAGGRQKLAGPERAGESERREKQEDLIRVNDPWSNQILLSVQQTSNN